MNKADKEAMRANIRAAMRKITAQFPDKPESKLVVGIINQAALDTLERNLKDGAEKYLRNSFHAEMCGVNPIWVRETFVKMGILGE